MRKYHIGNEYAVFRETRLEDRPRERIERLGSEALTDKELLMLLIGSGKIIDAHSNSSNN